MYYLYLPDKNAKLELVFKHRSIVECMLYAYGCGSFRLSNNRGFDMKYVESDFKDIQCTEPFFVMLNDCLTRRELDKFKKKLRVTIY